VLRKHDELGLLRYMEPGAGKLAIGKLPAGAQTNAAGTVMEKPVTEADKFAQRYMFTKCVEMVKAYRSHPSVIEYCLQNEIGADLNNPDTLAILKAMHDEDHSRCVVLNDGFVAPPRKAAQAWYAPYDDHIHRSDEEPWGGWWNQHQGAGDQWVDAFYKSPTDFTRIEAPSTRSSPNSARWKAARAPTTTR
jgi:beta-galactosidase